MDSYNCEESDGHNSPDCRRKRASNLIEWLDYIIDNFPLDDPSFNQEDEVQGARSLRRGLLNDLYRGRGYTEEDIHAIPCDQVLEEWQQSGVEYFVEHRLSRE